MCPGRARPDPLLGSSSQTNPSSGESSSPELPCSGSSPLQDTSSDLSYLLVPHSLHAPLPLALAGQTGTVIPGVQVGIQSEVQFLEKGLGNSFQNSTSENVSPEGAGVVWGLGPREQLWFSLAPAAFPA